MSNMTHVAGNLAKRTPHGSALGGEVNIYLYIYIYTCIYVHLDSANPAAVPSNDHISHQKEKGKPSTQEYLWRGCVCFQEGKHYNISVNPQ